MEATELLKKEHRIIERVLASLEVAAGRLSAGEPVAPGIFIMAADFIKGFADGCHHKKEEDVLFPAMQGAGIPREGGPIGVMLAEHEQGRRLTGGMRAAAEKLDIYVTGGSAAYYQAGIFVRYSRDLLPPIVKHLRVDV